VIRKISGNLVPAAINLYKARKATDGARELFLSVQRQKDQYQGIWIVSPEGRVLAGHQNFKDSKSWTDEVLETLDAGLKAFGEVTPREVKATNPLPHRGLGLRPDGGVQLALYGRQMLGGGRDTIPPGMETSCAWYWDGALRPDGPIMIDSTTLTAEEWATFVPARVEAGECWSVPGAVAGKFTRLLSASSDQSGMPKPDEATDVELQGRVESVEGGVARLRLRGCWGMKHLIEGDAKRPTFGEATALGTALYDVERKSMSSLLLVFDGTIRHGRPDAPPNRTGAVVEWRAK
jgi:hypothetical protein